VLDGVPQLVRHNEVNEVDLMVGSPLAHVLAAERAVGGLMPLDTGDVTAPAAA
jgi:hypothetical protein